MFGHQRSSSKASKINLKIKSRLLLPEIQKTTILSHFLLFVFFFLVDFKKAATCEEHKSENFSDFWLIFDVEDNGEQRTET